MKKKIFDFSNTYINLPNIFFQKIHPKKLNNPKLLELNTKLAETFGLKLNKDDKLLSEVFSGNVLPEGSEPLAMVYAGHQFGNFVSELGDGRAILLVKYLAKKEKFDLAKGSGVAKFSRNGDGQAPLGPVIRESSKRSHSLLGYSNYSFQQLLKVMILFKEKKFSLRS